MAGTYATTPERASRTAIPAVGDDATADASTSAAGAEISREELQERLDAAERDAVGYRPLGARDDERGLQEDIALAAADVVMRRRARRAESARWTRVIGSAGTRFRRRAVEDA